MSTTSTPPPPPAPHPRTRRRSARHPRSALSPRRRVGEGSRCFLPLHGLWLRDAASPPALTPISIALEGSGLVYSALKPAQIGSPTVLRCYNATGRKTAGAWRFAQGVKTAHRVRADEREAVALVLEQRGNVVRFVAEPHEIVSLLVT